MLSAILLMMQAAPVAQKPLPTLYELRFEECLTTARTDPSSAVTEALQWSQQDGDYLAKACRGFALASDFKFAEAVTFLTEAAQGADAKLDTRAVRFWAQAGNAAIAADMREEALSALDKAMQSAAPTNTERADIEVDRARTLVALNRADDAVAALSNARTLGPENATAWLLSATLARRLANLPDALAYIQTAATLSPRDPAVALEAGNIAVAAGDEATARKQWEQVIAIAPNSRQAATAQTQLAAMTGNPTPPVSDTQSR
jgi:tetratricopeptide (TPR) repeat protein